MNKTPSNTCPNCGAGIKHPSRQDPSKSYPYKMAVQYLCGSIASENWSPPLIYCAKAVDKLKKCDIVRI